MLKSKFAIIALLSSAHALEVQEDIKIGLMTDIHL